MAGDKLYRVCWPAGSLQLHASSAEKAIKVAVEYLMQPEAKRITADQVFAAVETP